MRLAELQRAFQAHVLEGAQSIATLVPGTERFPTAMRLKVYSAGYAERLIEALGHTYPALRQALGEAAFGSLVRTLAHRSPSRSFSVRYYGSELAALIARELKGSKAAGAADLARWEWALAEVFDEKDSEPLTSEALQQVSAERWAELRFRVVPALRTLAIASNAVLWWQAACAEGARPGRWRAARPKSWILWRRELAIYFRPLAGDELAPLEAVRSGAGFASVCEGLEPLRAATLLRRWLEEGLIAGLATGPGA